MERGLAKREEDIARKEEEINKTAKQREERSASLLITAMFQQSLIYCWQENATAFRSLRAKILIVGNNNIPRVLVRWHNFYQPKSL